MSALYDYTDGAGDRLTTDRGIGEDTGTFVSIYPGSHNCSHCVYLPASERVKAAQALAGDGYRVVPVEYAGPGPYEPSEVDGAKAPTWQELRDLADHNFQLYANVLPPIPDPEIDRPEPIDPADVEVGDVVEVAANDGTWMVRGEVMQLDRWDQDSPLRLRLWGRQESWIRATDTTVRVVSRPEPDPAEQEIQALGRVAQEAFAAAEYRFDERFDRELHARNVRVVKDGEQ